MILSPVWWVFQYFSMGQKFISGGFTWQHYCDCWTCYNLWYFLSWTGHEHHRFASQFGVTNTYIEKLKNNIIKLGWIHFIISARKTKKGRVFQKSANLIMVWLGLVWFGKIFVTSCASWVIWKSPIWLCLADLTPWLHGTNLLWLLASLLYPQRYGVNLWLSSTKPGLTWERGFLSLIFGDYESVLNVKSPLKHSDLASCKWLLSPFWMPNLSYSNNQGDQHTDIHKAYDTWYHKTMDWD